MVISIEAESAVTAETAHAVVAATPPVPAGKWRAGISRRLAISDFFVIAVVVFGTQWFWFDLTPNVRVQGISYWLVSAVLSILWTWALGLNDSRDYRLMASGVTEYVRVMSGSVVFFGVIAIVAYLAKLDVARGYLLLSLPVGVMALIVQRWAWRKWLIRRRKRGQFAARALLVGTRRTVSRLAKELRKDPGIGFNVVGVCVTDPELSGVVGTNIPVLGSPEDALHAMKRVAADTVILTNSSGMPVEQVRSLSWGLEAGNQHLVLVPSIIDVAGPRMQMRPVAGLSLIHVETPKFSLGQRMAKRTFDLVLSTIGLIVLAIPLLLLGLLVRLTSRGPVFYVQTRIGRGGKPFPMIKFRSMVPDADGQLSALLAERGTDDKPLFKVTDDPRITRLGRVMRKFSLDEFPQLINVVRGEMSLVGPRPQRPEEVALYDDEAHRRLLMKPGLTGVWQVSGRSKLSWEDAIRLDLSYVENWTLAGDIAILAKTVKVVIAPGDTAH